MMTQTTRPCYACETGVVRPTNLRGRRLDYRDEVELEFDEDLVIPTCDTCGELYLKGEASERVSAALERLRTERKRAAVAHFEATAARELPEVPKAAFEDLLGVSHGYLSRIARGTRVPDAALEILLEAFAVAPFQTLQVVAAARRLPAPIRDALERRGLAEA